MNEIIIDSITAGNGKPLVFIGGPCVIESRELTLAVASELKRLSEMLNIPFVFKSSFDKANRTSVNAFRGPGLKAGLEILSSVRQTLDIPILTDIHHPEQADAISRVADIIQIPAFLSRQTDLILAAAGTGSVINVKKGQFIAPWDVKNIISKIEETGNHRILITERGTCFGYNNLVSDMRSIPIMQGFGYPVVYDATHSAQLPGGKGDHTGGNRDTIPHLARAAVAAGCDAIFMEVHPDPDNAKSDAATQWPLDQTESLWADLSRIAELIRTTHGYKSPTD